MRSDVLVFLSLGRRPGWLDHLPDQPRARQVGGLVLGEGAVRQHGRVADDGGVGVAVDVGLPLPAGRVGVSGADELGLEALEFLLVA